MVDEEIDMKEHFKKILASGGLFLIMGNSQVYASSQCTYVPASERNSTVYACHTENDYQFEINGASLIYDKNTYQTNLSKYINTWVKTSDSLTNFKNAHVELWLSVPELNPSATQMRALITTNQKKFIMFLSIRPEEWRTQDYNIGILNQNESYPQSYGVKATSLLIKQQQNTSEDGFVTILSENGLHDITKFSGSWYQATTHAFGESAAVKKVMKSKKAQQYVEKIQTNAVVEWIALRELVFSFRLKSQD